MRKYRILLVEDDPDHAFLEKKAIMGIGKVSEVDTAVTAQEAMNLIKKDGYSLVLIDFKLPGMNGLELIKKITKIKNAPATMMLTGLGNEKIAVEAMKAGAYDYITKENDYLKHMVQAVESVLERHELARKLDKAKKELRESAIKLRALIEYSPHAAFMKGRSGKYVLLNKRAAYLVNSLGKKNLPTELRDHLSETDKEILKTKETRVVKVGTRSRDQETHFEISKYPVLGPRSEVIYICSICRDITEQRKIEQLKDNLIRDISHELKTPIAVATMANDMCRRALDENNSARMKKAQKIATENLDRLSKNVNNILNLFKLGASGNLEAEEIFSIKDVINEVEKDLKYDIENKNLRLEINVPDEVDSFFGGKRAIRTMMYNVIDNAVKFTEKGKIEVNVLLSGDWLGIYVKDQGRGISVKQIDKVFDRFYQQNTAVSGTGIGLTICKEIVALYGGSISVLSEGRGKGTVVTVKFPKDRVKRQEMA